MNFFWSHHFPSNFLNSYYLQNARGYNETTIGYIDRFWYDEISVFGSHGVPLDSRSCNINLVYTDA